MAINEIKQQFQNSDFARKLAQDFITFGILFGMFVWPFINATVIQPQQVFAQRLDKLEAAQEQTRQNISSIDKNLAVLAESTKRTDEALNAIRNFLSRDK